MASGRAVDVQVALQRAKKKICELQQQLKWRLVTESGLCWTGNSGSQRGTANTLQAPCDRIGSRETSSESPVTRPSPWTPSKELRDSLVDMYRGNPRVNVELQERLPSPARQHICNTTQHLSSPDRSGTSLSPDHDRPQAPQHLQDHLNSCTLSPMSQRRSVSPVSSLFQRWSVSSVSPQSCRRSVSPLSSRLPRGAGEMEVDLCPSRDPSPRAESCGDAPDEGGASRGPSSPTLRRHLVSTEDSPRQISATTRLQSFNRDKNGSFLLKELDALREVNNKLQEQLIHKEKELQRREVEEDLREEQREVRDWERPAAVLEEVLAAQKDRDQALMSRLLLANEERDEALLCARRLQLVAESEDVHLEDTGMDVDELLRRVCDAESGQEVQQVGSVLVQRLRLARQRQHDITAQEMKAVMEERDGSVAKFKRLEQDLQQDGQKHASQEELLRLQRERDGALEDRRRLEAEIEALRANHSSQDLAPPSQPSSAGSVAAPHQALPLLVQLQQLSKEKQSVEAELQRCQEAEREASERVQRLERLVEVLRKKVGAGSLRAVV